MRFTLLLFESSILNWKNKIELYLKDVLFKRTGSNRLYIFFFIAE